MAKTGTKTAVGWKIPTDVRDKFADWCDSKGFKVQDDCSGALVLWQHMPSILRELAKTEASTGKVIPDTFWDVFGKEFEKTLLSLISSQGHKLFEK